MVGISVQTGDYPLGRLAGRVDSLHEWLLVRLPFLFELTTEKFANLKSRFATSSWGGRRKRPFAFTEHGAIQAATILNSPRAVEMNVYVVRAFVKLREVLSSNRELARRFEQLESRLADDS